MKQLFLICALFAPLCQPLAAMDPDAGPNDSWSSSTALSRPLPKNVRRAPKGESEMRQILNCSETAIISFCLIKKGISLQENSALPHHERAPIYQLSSEGPVFKTIRMGIDDQFSVMDLDQNPLLKEALTKDRWCDFYTTVRTFVEEQYGPNATQETDCHVQFFLQNVHFLPNVTLQGVNDVDLTNIKPGVNWGDLKTPDAEHFFLKNSFPVWCAPSVFDHLTFDSDFFVMTCSSLTEHAPSTLLFHAGSHLTNPPGRSAPCTLMIGFWNEVINDHPFCISKKNQTPFRFTFFPQAKDQSPKSTKTKDSKALTLCDLPPELIQGEIMKYLDPMSISALSQTCTYMRHNLQNISKDVDTLVYAPKLAQDQEVEFKHPSTINLACALIDTNGLVTREEPWTMEVQESRLPTNDPEHIFHEVSKLTLRIKHSEQGTLIAKSDGILVGQYSICPNDYIAALSGIVDEGVRRHFRLKRQHQTEQEQRNKDTETSDDLAPSAPADPEAGPCA
jgi:hypothetical protein